MKIFDVHSEKIIDTYKCPQCGKPMVDFQREGVWWWSCPECGYEEEQ